MKLRSRKTTTAIIVHGIGGPIVGMLPEDVVRFFTDDPEGVATVALGGKYSDKVPVFTKWWVGKKPSKKRRRGAQTRIPERYLSVAYCPYHYLICGEHIYRCVSEDKKSAHARKWNKKSISIGLVRDIRKGKPLTIPEGKSLKDLVTYLCLKYPGVQVLDHDRANKKVGLKAKGCPGLNISRELSWAQLRANNMRD